MGERRQGKHCPVKIDQRTEVLKGAEMFDPMNAPIPSPGSHWWRVGTRVRKIKGASWQGVVVGFYCTSLTPEGYAVESEREPGSVQIYPRAALECMSE